MKTITLITVCYNSAQTLRDAIESVLCQTYHNIEYIIIDGASTDGTVDLIKEYEPKFGGRMSWISEKDGGIYDAMNKGIKMASGDVVGILNSDDLFTNNQAIENVMNCFSANPNVDCVYANLYYVDKNNTNKIVRYWICGEPRPFSQGWHPAHPTFYVKKNVYEKCGCFNISYKFAADFELMLRFVEKEKIQLKYLPEFLVKMRLGGATSKNFENVKNGNLECMRAFRDNQITVSRLYPIYRLLPKLKQFYKEK